MGRLDSQEDSKCSIVMIVDDWTLSSLVSCLYATLPLLQNEAGLFARHGFPIGTLVFVK